MLRTTHGVLVTSLLVVLNVLSVALADENASEIATDRLVASPGFFTCYWDDRTGKLWMEIDRVDQPFLYVSSLATGLGSNPVGLDRGQLGESRLVRFKRVGSRIFLIQMNLKYRATSDNLLERRAVEDSFAESVIWAAELEHSSAGIPVVDMTSFLLRDAHDCIGVLSRSGQGSYTLDRDRSYIYTDRTKSFEKNSEFEATLTFASSKPGNLASQAAADGSTIAIRQHHSFVALPDDNYQPRRWDPRVGCFSIDYTDYSAPIGESGERRLITRHRLDKTDPNAARSPVQEPIVYYVDPGVPQPIKDALVEGALWWREAFEAAGFEDAFQVKILPPEADPMDIRFNVIQWVHRATRGWSYGQSVIDPRTGEIIKGHVLLGSLRVRQDHRIFEGLHPSSPGIASAQFSSCPSPEFASPDAMLLAAAEGESEKLALARIRQLSAHEVGHTLGFAHNFAASTYGDRASVMDYPAPRITVRDGELDFSDAYGVGIGSWDLFATQYAYGQYPPEKEATELEQLAATAAKRGLLYISDSDARPAGAAHPLANLWDNGTEPVSGLLQALDVRKIAMQNFNRNAIPVGQSYYYIEQVFATVYLHHRYQVEATVKNLGGYLYEYSVRDANQFVSGDSSLINAPLIREVSSEDQIRALNALLKTLDSETLTIPDRILSILPPKTNDSVNDRERFSSSSSPVFDPISAMTVAADLTLGNILQPERAARLARTKQVDCNLVTVLTKIQQSLLPYGPTKTWTSANQVAIGVFVTRLINLATEDTNQTVQAIANRHLRMLYTELLTISQGGPDEVRPLFSHLASRIDQHLKRPSEPIPPANLPAAPPGSPIGNR